MHVAAYKTIYWFVTGNQYRPEVNAVHLRNLNMKIKLSEGGKNLSRGEYDFGIFLRVRRMGKYPVVSVGISFFKHDYYIIIRNNPFKNI